MTAWQARRLPRNGTYVHNHDPYLLPGSRGHGPATRHMGTSSCRPLGPPPRSSPGTSQSWHPPLHLQGDKDGEGQVKTPTVPGGCTPGPTTCTATDSKFRRAPPAPDASTPTHMHTCRIQGELANQHPVQLAKVGGLHHIGLAGGALKPHGGAVTANQVRLRLAICRRGGGRGWGFCASSHPKAAADPQGEPCMALLPGSLQPRGSAHSPPLPRLVLTFTK